MDCAQAATSWTLRHSHRVLSFPPSPVIPIGSYHSHRVPSFPHTHVIPAHAHVIPTRPRHSHTPTSFPRRRESPLARLDAPLGELPSPSPHAAKVNGTGESVPSNISAGNSNRYVQSAAILVATNANTSNGTARSEGSPRRYVLYSHKLRDKDPTHDHAPSLASTSRPRCVSCPLLSQQGDQANLSGSRRGGG